MIFSRVALLTRCRFLGEQQAIIHVRLKRTFRLERNVLKFPCPEHNVIFRLIYCIFGPSPMIVPHGVWAPVLQYTLGWADKVQLLCSYLVSIETGYGLKPPYLHKQLAKLCHGWLQSASSIGWRHDANSSGLTLILTKMDHRVDLVHFWLRSYEVQLIE